MNDKWIEEDEETWRSIEDEEITVCCNLEEDERFEEDSDEEYYQMYLVFSAYKNIGIPNSPAVFSEREYGSLDEAHREALRDVKKILKLPIEKIRKFEWSMIK